jgi:hypothetical protein
MGLLCFLVKSKREMEESLILIRAGSGMPFTKPFHNKEEEKENG